MNRQVDILLIEDNPGDVELIRECFSMSLTEFRLSIAQDGDEALQLLKKNAGLGVHWVPDLILLDLNLPKKTGREVLGEIKADVRLRKIPVVVLTTSSAESDVRSVYQLHANCLITKPSNLDDYIRAIQSIEKFWLKCVQLPLTAS